MTFDDFEMAVDRFIFLSRSGIYCIYVNSDMFNVILESKSSLVRKNETVNGNFFYTYNQHRLYYVLDVDHQAVRILPRTLLI